MYNNVLYNTVFCCCCCSFNAFKTVLTLVFTLTSNKTATRGRAVELCSNVGVIICPLDHHMAMMRLEGWIIHFQPDFPLN